jgi:hypothetical protein
MSNYIPYVYFITFTNPNTLEKLYYIGSEYSEVNKVANPLNLFTIYDTSSTKVKELISEFGKECFTTSIRKIFKTGKEATTYEEKLLKRLNAVRRKDFINLTDNCKLQRNKGKLSSKSRRKSKIKAFEKYGVEHHTQSNEFKSKLKISILEKHGVEYITQSELFKESTKETFIEKYGVENPSQIESVKQKKKNTMLERFGVEHPGQLNKKKVSHKGNVWSCVTTLAKHLNTTPMTVRRWIKHNKYETYYI